jgi:hypothetical protein
MLVPAIADPASALRVVDRHGAPIRAATVTFGRRDPQPVDADGEVDVPGVVGRQIDVLVRAGGFEDLRLNALPDVEHAQITLERRPLPLDIRVVDPDGRPIEAAITVATVGEMPVTSEVISVDEVGTRHYTLSPGDWQVTIDAPGMGRQERHVVVSEFRTEPMRVDAVLSPTADPSTHLVVTVHDPDGRRWKAR